MKTSIYVFSVIFLISLSGLNINSSIDAPAVADPGLTEAVRDIVINSDDQTKFDLSEIRVKAGEKVKITLNHTGKLAKNAMGHNFVLLEKGTDVTAFATEATNAKNREYIPTAGALAHTKLIGGGESTSVTFTAPAKGTYDFICSFPVIMQ